MNANILFVYTNHLTWYRAMSYMVCDSPKWLPGRNKIVYRNCGSKFEHLPLTLTQWMQSLIACLCDYPTFWTQILRMEIRMRGIRVNFNYFPPKFAVFSPTRAQLCDCSSTESTIQPWTDIYWLLTMSYPATHKTFGRWIVDLVSRGTCHIVDCIDSSP